MKKIILFTLLILSSSILLGQTAYIQVDGEPNLSVFLNNKFKAKTTAEIGGCIIENVTPGKNLIKIIKEGFTPFEETIIVKANEVLAYKVKPFTKHKVFVSEEGNTAETNKKAIVKTGKLIVQSVPIEIKITIPDIEGINKSAKTKDKWQADEIPAGSYKITFTYNQKAITKIIEIIENETTSVFVNMINNDVKINDPKEDKRKGEVEFMNYTYFRYYEIGLLFVEAKTKYPDYFKNFSPYKYIDDPNLDTAYYSETPIGLYAFYSKNGKLVGYAGYIQPYISDDSNFSKGNEAISKIVDDFNTKFSFSPTIKNTSYNSRGYNFDVICYTWEKNKKSISVAYTKKYSQNDYKTQIHLVQYDNQIFK